MKKVLYNIIRLRHKAGLSQSVLAEKIGMSRTAYGKIERGDTVLDFNHISLIASALGVSEETVLEGETSDEEALLRENTYRDTLVRALRSELEEANTTIDALRAEISDKEKQLAEVRELNAFLKQQAALYERHPSGL